MKPSAAGKFTNPAARISISLPANLLTEMDRVVAAHGYCSRSQAICDMINYRIAEHKHALGNEIMVGTLTLLYDRSTKGLQERIADIQHRHLDEVISSLHVHLTENQILEVILIQGPATILGDIADELITLRGIITGRLQLLAAIIPPLHPLPTGIDVSTGKRSAPSQTLRVADQCLSRKETEKTVL